MAQVARLLWSHKHEFLFILGAFLAARLMMYFVTYLGLLVWPVWSQPEWWRTTPDNLVLFRLSLWDGAWYENIALRGYSIDGLTEGKYTNVVFFPLYPMLARAVYAVLNHGYLSLQVVSGLGTLLGVGYCYWLARLEADKATAQRMVWYIVCAPAAVFFSAAYTEGLFLLLAAACFVHARRGDWLLAGIAAGLASACRLNGAFLGGVILLEALYGPARVIPHGGFGDAFRHLGQTLRSAWRVVVALLLAPLGFVAYASYLQVVFGDFLLFSRAQDAYERSGNITRVFDVFVITAEDLKTGPRFLAGQMDPNYFMPLVVTLVALPFVVAVAVRMRPAYGFFTVMSYVLPLASTTVLSMNRYIMTIVPVFLLLAMLGKRDWVDKLIMLWSLPLMAYTAIVFSHAIFAG